MTAKLDKYINYTMILMVVATLGLVITELYIPGYCPNYPVFNVPACYVMLSYFSLMLLGQYMKRNSGVYLLYTFGIIAFFSSLYFSYNELNDIAHCPQAFNIPIPLCYTVYPIMGLVIFWKIRSRKLEK